jgi:glycosyltransferase 2 family protein
MADRKGIRTGVQALFVVAVLWFGGRLLWSQWSEVRALRATLTTDWLGVLAASLVVFASYAVLIATWRATVQAWGERIALGPAVRIWFVSNLGRYLPGKVWQIGAMGVMAKEAGVAPEAAIGSALVVSLVHLLVGFAAVAATGGELLGAFMPPDSALPWVLALLSLGVFAAPWILPALARLAARVTGREIRIPHLPVRAIWLAALGSAVAWVLQGVAFRLLTVAVLGRVTGDAATSIAVFTLSYQLGFVALFAPGGIGVREASMHLLLVTAGLNTAPEATLLVVISRLWLTVLEILPGALFLTVARPAPRAVLPPPP